MTFLEGTSALTFGVPPADPLAAHALDALSGIFRRLMPFELLPRPLSSYAALEAAVRSGECPIAWCPPFVALDLLEDEVARPLVALERKGGTQYAAVLVVRDAHRARSALDLAGATVGWIARESAAGYLVPRAHLVSLGVDPGHFFGGERLFGSHPAAAAALRVGEVDVIATYARYLPGPRAVMPPALGFPTRVVMAAGPVPGDLIVARADLPAVVQQAASRAFVELPLQIGASLREFMGTRRFVPATRSHAEALARLRTSRFAAALDVFDPSIEDPPTGV